MVRVGGGRERGEGGCSETDERSYCAKDAALLDENGIL